MTKAANVTAGTGQACITIYCKTRSLLEMSHTYPELSSVGQFIIVIQTPIQQSTTKDILFPIFLLLFRLILFTATSVKGKGKSPP